MTVELNISPGFFKTDREKLAWLERQRRGLTIAIFHAEALGSWARADEYEAMLRLVEREYNETLDDLQCSTPRS